MKNLIGHATLSYLGKELPCEVVIDFGSGQLEVVVGKELSTPQTMKQLHPLVANDQPRLKDMRFHTAAGVLSLAEYSNLFMTEHEPGTTSVHQSLTQLALRNVGESVGLSRMVLQPKSSRIAFDFEPVMKTDEYELTLETQRFSTLTTLELRCDMGNAAGVVSGHTLVLRSQQDLMDRSEQIALAVGLMQGGGVKIRSNVGGGRFILDVAPHEQASLGAVGKTPTENAQLTQGLLDFLTGLDPIQYERYRRAAYFYLQGVGGKASLDSRMIDLYVALEMLDGADQLGKQSVASTLAISEGDADLICRVRNDLIHHGSSIGMAVLKRQQEIRDYVPSFAFLAFALDPQSAAANTNWFFFGLATLLCKFWVRKAGQPTEIREYIEYLANC